ncbi:MAG: hypothetical protein H7A50_09585 [Akkermansiaceae bacterium]|nr:hypothetical protein [Akkermansiaceae bacterium]
MSAVLAAAVSLINSVASGQRVDVWDLPPLRYSDSRSTDKLAALAGRLSDGRLPIPGAGALEKLRFVLKELQVPESSQILVFSKTSVQSRLIHPANPRCLYFSKDAYVGYVPARRDRGDRPRFPSGAGVLSDRLRRGTRHGV